MSRAFVREDDQEEAGSLPDRVVSEHRNFVTAEGLAQIDEEIARLNAAYAAAQAGENREELAGAARDLRYWAARRASAEVVDTPRESDRVRFGSVVTIKREDGRKQTFRIVGEDEAEPSKGTLSYMSPLARALMGKEQGDVVEVGDTDAEIVSIAV